MDKEELLIKEYFKNSKSTLLAETMPQLDAVLIDIDQQQILLDKNGVKALNTFLADYIEKLEELEK